MEIHSLKIYQAEVEKDFCFRDYGTASMRNTDFKTLKDYNLVYEGKFECDPAEMEEVLEEVYTEGNIGQLRKEMARFCKTARSISVSDIIELDGTRYYCNPFGFIQIKVA